MSTAKECGAEVPKHFPCRPDETFGSDDSWDIDGITLEVIHTPGHTPGSVCLLSDADKVVCTGDTLLQMGMVVWISQRHTELVIRILSEDSKAAVQAT